MCKQRRNYLYDRLSTSKWSAWQTSRIGKVFWQISFNLSKITASKHLPLLCFSTRTSNLEDSCHSMFFQLKLQTFLIKVGFHKAEIHKMARWHLVYHLLGSGGKKKQEWSLSSCWNEKFRYHLLRRSGNLKFVIMIVSDQNKLREMCTTEALCSCVFWKVMITKFGNLSKFGEWGTNKPLRWL